MKKIKTILAYSLLTLTHPATANNNIACPSLEIAQQSASKLVEATFVNSSYIANTLPFAIHASNLDWFAVVLNIHATSTEHALQIARATMQNVSSQDNLYAKNLGGIYLCDYDQQKIEIISNDDPYKLFSFVYKNST